MVPIMGLLEASCYEWNRKNPGKVGQVLRHVQKALKDIQGILLHLCNHE